jgi:hypothetical protein
VAAGASSYQVYRSTSPDKNFAPVGTTTGLSYTDENLNWKTTYYYNMRALNTAASGQSPLSAQASATTSDPPPSITNLTYSSISGGTWAVQSDGSRKSPSISYGSMTKARVSFTSHIANASVTIQLRVNSSISNFAFISTLDNAAATSSGGYYSGSRISRINSVSITIPVPSPGDHFIDIGFQTGANYSSSGSDDGAWFTVTNY